MPKYFAKQKHCINFVRVFRFLLIFNMVLKKRKISTGWLLVLVALLVTGALGLNSNSHAANFNLAGNHLWANIAWMITATIFVLMMTPGLSFFYGGMVRPKNVISTMLQSFIVMGFVSVIWVVFGFGLAFGNDICHIIGNPMDFFMMNNAGVTNVTAPEAETSQIGLATTTIPLALFALFQMKFAIITPRLSPGPSPSVCTFPATYSSWAYGQSWSTARWHTAHGIPTDCSVCSMCMILPAA